MLRPADLSLQIVPGPANVAHHRAQSGASAGLCARLFRHHNPQDDVEKNPKALHQGQQDERNADPKRIDM